MAFLRSLTSPSFTRRHSASRALWLCFACAGGLLTLSLNVAAQEIEAPEPAVKAAFLYNFTKLVTWPTNTFASSNAPLIIGVLGKDPFGRQLDNALAGRMIGPRKLQPERYKQLEAATNCHLLFISDSERRKLDAIFTELGDKPILTVSDIKGFASQGMIEMVKTNDTINLRINLEAATRANLKLSSQLIRLDRSLRPPGLTSTNAPAQKPPLIR